jgi:hypothetical protein
LTATKLGGISIRYVKYIAITGSLAVWPLGTALASEMTGAEMKDLISGKTAYVETTAESVTGAAGAGVIYYGADGNVLWR